MRESHTAANVAGKNINVMPATVFMDVLSSLVSAAIDLDSLAIDTLVSLSCCANIVRICMIY